MSHRVAWLVPFEIGVIIAAGIVPLPDTVPVAMPLAAAAALSLWIRKRSFASGRGVGLGALAGLTALVVALVLGSPVVEGVTDRAVMWSSFPIVRGSIAQAVMVAVAVSAAAVAMELALRGWILQRARELAPRAHDVVGIAAGALAEALVTPGDGFVRAGAALFGAGLGWLAIATGGLAAPIAARVAFVLGALVLEAAMLVG